MKSGTVAIIGRPNSGKSTLLNALVGEKVSIIASKPQTTRHRILGVRTEPHGQAVFVDTPGIHKPSYRMNQRMVQVVHQSLRETDLVLLVVDGSRFLGSGERFALEIVRKSQARALLLINKIDRMSKPDLLPIMDRYGGAYDFLEIIPISALKKDNLALLLQRVFQYLPEGEPRFDSDQITDRTERFLTAELIREKILNRTRQEMPYATAVVIRQFDESVRQEKKLVHIDADILVEKKSQKGIILGRGGVALRDLGKEARADIEDLLGCRVYLGLTVCAKERWRDNEWTLDDLELGG